MLTGHDPTEQTLLGIVEKVRGLGAIRGPAPPESVWVSMVRDPADLSTWHCGLKPWADLLEAQAGLERHRDQAARMGERMEPFLIGLKQGETATWALGVLVLDEAVLPALRRYRAATARAGAAGGDGSC